MVEGGFDRLGYTPIREALQRCEGKVRYRVMAELNRSLINIEFEKIHEKYSFYDFQTVQMSFLWKVCKCAKMIPKNLTTIPPL